MGLLVRIPVGFQVRIQVGFQKRMMNSPWK